MKKLILAALLALGVAATAWATGGEPLAHGYPIKIAKIDLDGAAGARTFTINMPTLGYATVVFWQYFDYTANAGIISLTCTGGPSNTDNGYTLTICDPASATGECTAYNAGILKSAGSLAADTKWDAKLGMRGAAYLSCVAAHSGTPGAGEDLYITYVVISQ